MTDVRIRKLRLRIGRDALPRARQLAREVARQIGEHAAQADSDGTVLQTSLHAELPARAAGLPPGSLARRIGAALAPNDAGALR